MKTLRKHYCVICDKEIKNLNNVKWVQFDTLGNMYYPDEDIDDSLGVHEVGPNCYQNFLKEKNSNCNSNLTKSLDRLKEKINSNKDSGPTDITDEFFNVLSQIKKNKY